jgi:thiol-disulfide isomerase/thioredoxin
MTKCHLLVLAAFLILVIGCKPDKGPTLSEYGSRSQATQEVAFEQYVRELKALPLAEAFHRQDSVMTAAESDSAQWQVMVKMQEHFLFDPNSPYRDEELYIPVADHMLNSIHATEEQRAFAQWCAPRIMLNRPGTPAADFSFQTKNGRTHTLYETIGSQKIRPERTLLFFSNPGCPNCKEITEALSQNEKVQAKIDAGKLLVINIYPDEDVQAWLDYLPNYPPEWVCGHDPDQVLNSHTRYWLRAIPSLYLLDKEKRVILKDATLENLLAALSF